MDTPKKYYPRKKKKIYKRLIEIKSNLKGWVVVELLSINKGGTITIKTIDGHVIKRKINKIRWTPSKRKEREAGIKPTVPLKTPLSKKGIRKKKRQTLRKSRKLRKEKEVQN